MTEHAEFLDVQALIAKHEKNASSRKATSKQLKAAESRGSSKVSPKDKDSPKDKGGKGKGRGKGAPVGTWLLGRETLTRAGNAP